MTETILKGRRVVGGKTEGEALVAHEPVSFYHAARDHTTGTIVEKGHELEGVSFAGKILVYPTGKGSTGGSFGLYQLAKHNTAPKGIINIRAESITAVGAVISKIPMVHQLDRDPTKIIKTGDYLEIDGDQGIVKIKKRAG